MVSSVPRFTPSNKNCTPDTPTLSEAAAVIVTVVPATVALFVGALSDTVGAVVSDAPVTVKLNDDVRTIDPLVPVTVMVEVPVGVEPAVVIVNAVLQVGLQEVGLNVAVAPVGRPEAP